MIEGLLSNARTHTDKNYTKISCEYSAIKRWLRCRDIPHIQKISHVRTIKNGWLMTKTSATCADKNHKKIGREYIAKICYLRTSLSHARTRDIPRIQKISDEYVIKIP